MRNREWTTTHLITQILNTHGPIPRTKLYSLLKLYGHHHYKSASQCISLLKKYKALVVRYDIYTGIPTYRLTLNYDSRSKTIAERTRTDRSKKYGKGRRSLNGVSSNSGRFRQS